MDQTTDATADKLGSLFRAYYNVLAYQIWMAERSYILAVRRPSGFRIDGSPVFQPSVDVPSKADMDQLLQVIGVSVWFFIKAPRAVRTVAMVEGVIAQIEELLRRDEEAGDGGLEVDLRQEFEGQLAQYRVQRDRIATELENKVEPINGSDPAKEDVAKADLVSRL